MARPVAVRHPVPARVVPSGRRQETWRLVRHVTPIAIREIPAQAPAPLDRVFPRHWPWSDDPPEHRAWFLEGRLWTPIGSDYGPDRRIVPFDAGAFLGWLSSDVADPTETVTGLGILSGTPLFSRRPRGYCHRGLTPERSGRLLEWDPDRASADLETFCRDNLVLAGDTPFMCLDAPLAAVVTSIHGTSARIELINPFSDWSLTTRTDRIVALSRAVGLSAPARSDIPVPEVDPATLGDGDLLRFANRIPGEMISFGHRLTSRARNKGTSLPEPFRDLEPWERRSELGGIGLAEIEALCRAVLDCVETVPALFPDKVQASWLRRVDGYVRDFALPLLRSGQASDDDIRALGSLAI